MVFSLTFALASPATFTERLAAARHPVVLRVWIPPGQKHWHGASPDTAMTHIAIQEQLNGKVVEWMEKVSDDQYRK